MAVVGELVAGAALGTVFSELYGGVQKLSKSNKPLLDDLQITLDSLKPIVDEMRDCNDELDPSCKEMAAFHSKIEEGVKLVCKLSTVDKWYKNRTCIKQLVELNGSLKTHIKVLTVPKLYDFIHLKNLSITNFHKLSTLPEEVGNLINLQVLRLNSCSKLSELPGSVTSINKLNFLEISDCDSITELPEDVGNLINLQVLRLNSCPKLSELPGSVTSLNKLNFLDISDCYSITELPEDIGNMSSLRKLNMTRCSKVNKLPLSVLYLDQLEGVVCDEETKKLWEPFLPYLENLRLEMAQENRFLRQINLIVVRTQKRDVMNKIVQSHVSSVRFDLQAEVNALGEKLQINLIISWPKLSTTYKETMRRTGRG